MLNVANMAFYPPGAHTPNLVENQMMSLKQRFSISGSCDSRLRLSDNSDVLYVQVRRLDCITFVSPKMGAPLSRNSLAMIDTQALTLHMHMQSLSTNGVRLYEVTQFQKHRQCRSPCRTLVIKKILLI